MSSPVPGGTCPACGLTFPTSQVRNLHMMRRHADRRNYRVSVSDSPEVTITNLVGRVAP